MSVLGLLHLTAQRLTKAQETVAEVQRWKPGDPHLHCSSLVPFSFSSYGRIVDILSDRFWSSEFLFLFSASPLGCVYSSTPFTVMTGTTNMQADILLTLQSILVFPIFPGRDLPVLLVTLCHCVQYILEVYSPASKPTPQSDKGIESEGNYKYLGTFTDSELQWQLQR